MNGFSTKYSLALSALALVLQASVVMSQPVEQEEYLQLPRRQNRLVIDGDLSDWKGPSLKVELSEPELQAPLRNTGVFQLVWDAELLWFAVEIEDAEVFLPPESITGSAVYQWDSIEIYIDGHANRSVRMDENDTQLIVSGDGRNGAMHGDEMLHNVDDWLVPKRKHLGLAVETAAQRTATGYIVEGAFPWSAVDVTKAKRGQVVAIDLAWNDWIEDHPQLPELEENLENLAAIYNNELDLAVVDPESLGWQGLADWENRAYRPRAWCTGSDFGLPTEWQLVKLSGRPPFTEALVDRWGLVPLLVGIFFVLLIISVTVDLRLRRRYQVKVRELLTRIEGLSTPLEPTENNKDHWTNRLENKMANVSAEAGTDDTLDNILFQINSNMGKTLSVGDLATSLGTSPRTLQRICQDELGASPRDVILAVKMRRAHEALETGKWRVGEVATQVGFDSPYHFSRRFKDFFDATPSSIIPPRKTQ